MRFWVDWELWQKLSVVVAALLFLVLIYSICALIRNRGATKKHAAAEARLKVINDVEANEVPFGAPALERGVYVEGIWTPSLDSPTDSSAPIKENSVVPGLKPLLVNSASVLQKPTQTYTPMSQISQPDLRSASEVPDRRMEVSGSLHSNPSHANTLRKVDAHDVGKHQDVAESDTTRLKARFNSRSSWIGKPFDKRMSGIEGTRQRTSSEEFRRRISKLFDENVQARPADMFQLQSVPSESGDSHPDELTRDLSENRLNFITHR